MDAPPTPPTSIITGATDGIGRVVARRLARAGHRVILLARDPKKAEAVRAELAGEAEGATVEWVRCDLASLASVRAAAAEAAERAPVVDVLVNNAARFGARFEESADGIEAHLAVNYLAPFLLTHLLLPRLREARAGRIVNVSGETARFASVDLADLERRRRFRTLAAYGQSKLALILFTRSLAPRLARTRVTVNALHPGTAATNHLADGPRWLHALWSKLLPGSDGAAGAVARLALDPALEGVTGRYYLGKIRAPAPFAAYRRALAEALYQKSAAMVGVEPLAEAT